MAARPDAERGPGGPAGVRGLVFHGSVVVLGRTVQGRLSVAVRGVALGACRAGVVCLLSAKGLAAQAPAPDPADTLRAAIERSRASGDSTALAEAHNGYGLLLWNQSRFDSAMVHLQEALRVWTLLDDSVGLGRVHNNLGVTHYQWGNLGLALEEYHRSLEVRRALGDDRGTALVLTNIGRIQQEWDQPALARETLRQAVVHADASGEPWVRGYARHNLGMTLLKAGDLDGARAAMEESIRIYESGDPAITAAQVRSGRGLNLHGLARVLLAEGRADEAVAMLEGIIGGSLEDVRRARQADVLITLGKAYTAQGNLARAQETLDRALELSREAAQRLMVQEALLAFVGLEEARGRTGQALEHLRAYVALRDSLAVQRGAQQIAAVGLRAEVERHQDEIRDLRRAREVQAQVIARQRLGFVLGTALLGLMVLWGVTLLRFNRAEKARRRMLAEANEALEKANQELRDALAEVRTLSGLIPICARCKKVRDDDGYWESVETYIASRSDALFTHGICNTCGPELYGSEWGV